MIAAISVRDTLDDGTGDHRVPGNVVPAAVELVRRLKADGYSILILDAYANDVEGLRMLFHWLHSHDVPFDEIWQSFGCPVADVYVNNRSRKCTSKQ